MKIACSLLFSAFSACIVLGQSAAPVSSTKGDHAKEACTWPANLDGVIAAPETHKVIFGNEHVRVLEVTTHHTAENQSIRIVGPVRCISSRTGT